MNLLMQRELRGRHHVSGALVLIEGHMLGAMPCEVLCPGFAQC